MNNIYSDGTYLKNNPGWHEEDSPWKAGEIIKILSKNGMVPNTVCEVGCGAGEILRQLYLKFPNNVSFEGFEISDQAFQIAEKKTCDRLQFFNKDVRKNANKFYDLLLAIDVIEHVENYMDFLRELQPLADYKIFHIPLDLSAQSVIRKKQLINFRYKTGHLNYFTQSTALAILKDAGYQVLDHVYTGSHIYAKTHSIKADLMKIPRLCMFMLNEDFAARLLGGFSLLVLCK